MVRSAAVLTPRGAASGAPTTARAGRGPAKARPYERVRWLRTSQSIVRSCGWLGKNAGWQPALRKALRRGAEVAAAGAHCAAAAAALGAIIRFVAGYV